MDKTLGQKCYQLYLESVENLKKDDPSLVDEVIVALFKTVEAVTAEKKKFTEKIATLEKENRDYFRKQDMLESRCEILQKKLMSYTPPKPATETSKEAE